jgi:hypothetical protein
MGLNRQEKAAVVEEVGALVASSQSIVVAEYRGLDVDAITRLRKQARGQGVQLRVLKNTLARRAVGGTPFSGLSDRLVGPQLRHGRKGRQAAGHAAEPRRVAGKADGHDAGANRPIRSHAERSAVAPGAYLGSHTRLEGCTRVTTSKNLNRYNAFF